MKKRILCVILAIVMVALMAPSVMAADTVLTIEAKDVEIKKGTTSVEVDIEITSNPGVATLGFDVGYDNTALTLKSVKNGVIFADDEIDSNTAKNPFIISAVCGTENKTAKGVLVTLVFDVKSAAATGTYNITLSENATLGGYYNYAEKDVPATLVSGSVTIASLGGISGTTKSFGTASDATTIELLSGNAVIATKTVTGNSSSYSFADLEAGTYKLRVSKSKHVKREYAVTVSNKNITQNVEIWLYGDITKDGNINSLDTLQLNRKIANLSSVMDSQTDKDYRFKVANVSAITGTDTILNGTDVLHINRKIANLSSVFNTLK